MEPFQCCSVCLTFLLRTFKSSWRQLWTPWEANLVIYRIWLETQHSLNIVHMQNSSQGSWASKHLQKQSQGLCLLQKNLSLCTLSYSHRLYMLNIKLCPQCCQGTAFRCAGQHLPLKWQFLHFQVSSCETFAGGQAPLQNCRCLVAAPFSASSSKLTSSRSNKSPSPCNKHIVNALHSTSKLLGQDSSGNFNTYVPQLGPLQQSTVRAASCFCDKQFWWWFMIVASLCLSCRIQLQIARHMHNWGGVQWKSTCHI